MSLAQLASLAPWAAVLATLLIKLTDYRVSDRQRWEDEQHDKRDDDLSNSSSDLQFLVKSLIVERDKAISAYDKETQRRRIVEEEVDGLREYIFEMRSMVRDLLLSSNNLPDSDVRLLTAISEKAKESTDDDDKNRKTSG